MKRFKFGVVTMATVGALAASAALMTAPVAAVPTTTITYFTFSAAPDHLTDLNKMVAAFEKQNPTIKVKVQTASYNDYFTKLKTRLAGSSAPDVFELNYENFVSYAASKQLLNLNSVIAKDKTFKKSAYVSGAYNVFNQNKVQYGLPESFSTVVMFYNKDLFDAAGVGYPKSTWTWANEEYAATKLKSKLPSGTYADFQPIQFWEFYKVLGQSGGKFLSADKSKAYFNSLKGVQALNWMVGKIEKGLMPTSVQMGGLDDGAMFKAGKLAMLHSGIWMFDSFKDADFDWDIVVEPGGETKGNHFFANAVVASSKTKKASAAWKWMRFFTSSNAAVKIRVDSAWELPATSAQAPLASYLNKTNPANRKAVFEALKNPITPPVIKQQSQLQDTVNEWLEKAKNGTVSVTEALNKAAYAVNRILANE